MAIGFNIQFRINEKTPSRVIRLTDSSSGFTLSKGNFSIVFPDGTSINHTDLLSPDINASGQYYDFQAPTDIYGNVLTGAYSITFVAIDNASNSYTLVKPFDFNWIKPTKNIVNLSDTMIPEVKFQDSTVYTQSGSFTGVLTSRTFNVLMPTTSAVTGTTITASSDTIDAKVSNNYYEGLYTPKSDIVVTYTHTTLSTALTVIYTALLQVDFSVKKAPTRLELITRINLFRTQVDAYKTTNDTQFQILSEVYDILIALYSHLIERAQTSTLDGSQPILVEILDILDKYTPYTYQSTPISAFYIQAFGLGSVTSVALTAPTGLSVSGSPITTSGTLGLTFTTGYSIPTTIKQSNWDDSYTWVSAFPTQTGNAGKFLSTDGSVLSWATNPLGTVTSVGISVPTGFSVTGSPITTSGTLSLSFASGYSLPSDSTQAGWSAKQNALNGTGFVKASGTTISYDNTTYYPYPSGTSSQYITGAGALSTFLTDVRGGISLTTNGSLGAATYNSSTGVFNIPNYSGGFTSVTASASQVVLTASSPLENYVSGSGGQTFKLPDATTLVNGATFSFNNNQSSGAILVNNNSNTLIVSVPSGGYTDVMLIDNSTAAGSWDRHFSAPSNVSWSTNTFDYAGSITSATWNGNVVAINRGGTGASTASGALSNLGGITLTSLSGTAPITYNNTTGAIGITQATTTTNGYLSSTDWNTFNGKQAALTNPVTGTGTTNYVPKFTGASAIGNSLIYDNGTNVTINGTAGTGLFNVTGSKTASSALAQGVYYTPTLVASANGDVLVGLDIAPTFTNGSFTGVSNIAIRTPGATFSNGTSGGLTIQAVGTNQGITFGGTGAGYHAFNGIGVIVQGGLYAINGINTTNTDLTLSAYSGGNINFNPGATASSRFFASTGNLLLQRGGTFTDAGYRLDVAGTTRFTGTTASDTAPLGSELAAVTGTGTNWTLAGTNLNVGGYTHTVGSTTPLTTSLAAVSGTYYQITYTITGRTAGSITIAYGGTSTTASASGNTGPIASSTSVLTITPTTDFDGTVVLSIKSIGTSSASSTFSNSSGTSIIEFRTGSDTTNTFIGLSSGRRITTSISNTFIGSLAGQSNTTASYNTFIGHLAGSTNITGAQNSFLGSFAGQLNSTGGQNTFLGPFAGQFNTTGSNNTIIGALAGRNIADGTTSATIMNNSILIGHFTKPLADSQTNQIVIGQSATGLGSNTTVLGNSSTVTTAIYGNLLLGTTATTGANLTSSASITAASNLARGVYFNNTLVASANNDVLVGLDINPTFTNGSFTTNFAFGLRIIPRNNSQIALGGTSNAGSLVFARGSDGTYQGGIGYTSATTASDFAISSRGGSGVVGIDLNAGRIAQFVANGLILQNGGTFTDAGYRLDVFGTTRFTGTTASDGGQLGSELTTTGSGTNWSGTGFATGYTHTTGSTVDLTTTLAAVSGTYYQITYTISGRTTGSITINFGGTSTSGITASGNAGPKATSTAVLTITPTTDFNGTLILSIKTISTSVASSTFSNSSGTANIEFRTSSSASNTFIGGFAGSYNTTGNGNTFLGYSTGQYNTTGSLNTFIGHLSGNTNSTATENVGLGYGALNAISTGVRNVSVGANSLLVSTIGTYNSTLGHGTFQNLTSGAFNVAIGGLAGRYFGGSTSNALISSDNSIFIGYTTMPLANSQTNQIVIGNQTTGLGSNTTIIGNSSTTQTALYGSLTLGTTSTTASALLSMSSTTQGFLPPVMTSTQRAAISSPAKGLIVFDSTMNKLYVYTTVWEMVTSV